jgi:hypothetical protein
MNPLRDIKVLVDYKWGNDEFWKAFRHAPSEKYYQAIEQGAIKTGFMRTEAAIKTGRPLHKIPVVGPALSTMELIGQYTEEVPRLAMWHWAERKGPKLWKKFGVSSAAEVVKKFHVDYSKITPFESAFMRRLMPFYSWYRFNVPLHIQMIPNAPGFYANVDKLRKTIGEATGGEPQQWWAPEYIRQGYSVPWGGKPGMPEYVILRGWYPAADITSVLSIPEMKNQFLQMLHPAKLIPETIWGYDTFRQRKIPAYPGETVPVFGVKVPAKLAHIILAARLVSDANTLIFGRPNVKTAWWDRVIFSLIGKKYTVNEAIAKTYLRRDINAALQNIDFGIRQANKKGDSKRATKLMQQKSKLESSLKQL